MYAVIETGGKQVRVAVGDVVEVERLDGDPGSAVVFDRVLLLGQDESIKLGSPTLGGARVRGTVVRQGRHPKIVLYTFKRRQNSNRRRAGHRQHYTAVKIEAIEASS
jgi:large subunit ribosomal protein L21